METENKNTGFRFTYSAAQQEEIQNIRQKYMPKEEDKMAQLRRLDASVTNKATGVSIALGIIGALIMGSGMSLIMTNLGNNLGMSGIVAMILGIILGLAGIVLVGLAYPVYNRLVRKERERIAPEILRLTDELMK